VKGIRVSYEGKGTEQKNSVRNSSLQRAGKMSN